MARCFGNVGGDNGVVFVGWRWKMSEYDVGRSGDLGCMALAIERMGDVKYMMDFA